MVHRRNFIDVQSVEQVDTRVDKYQPLSFGTFHNVRPSQVCICIVTIRVIGLLKYSPFVRTFDITFKLTKILSH